MFSRYRAAQASVPQFVSTTSGRSRLRDHPHSGEGAVVIKEVRFPRGGRGPRLLDLRLHRDSVGRIALLGNSAGFRKQLLESCPGHQVATTDATSRSSVPSGSGVGRRPATDLSTSAVWRGFRHVRTAGASCAGADDARRQLQNMSEGLGRSCCLHLTWTFLWVVPQAPRSLATVQTVMTRFRANRRNCPASMALPCSHSK